MKTVRLIAVLSLLYVPLRCLAFSDFCENGGVLDPMLAPVDIPRVETVESHERRPITSMDLLEIRDLKGLSISPDGKFVAFVVGQAVYGTNGYRSALYVVDVKDGRIPLCLGTAGLPRWDSINQWLPQAPQWSPDSKSITYLTKMNAMATRQVWRWSTRGGSPSEVTHVPGDAQSFHWSHDGRRLIVSFARSRSNEEATRLSENGIQYDGQFDPARARPVVSEVLAAVPETTEIWIHDMMTGEERKQTETETETDTRKSWVSDIGEDYFNYTTFAAHHLLDAKISPNGREVAYRVYAGDSPDSKAIYQLFLKPVRGGTPVNAMTKSYMVSEYWWSKDSRKIYFFSNLGTGRPDKLMVVPVSGGEPREVLTIGAALYPCAPDDDFRYLACGSESKKSPAQILLVDVQTGAARILVDLNPEFSRIELGSSRRIEGLNKYGDRWWADLVKPLNYEPGKKYPLIVTTYRTREFPRGASGDENPVYVYAANGFAVLSFDMGTRDFDNSPGDFQRNLSWYESEEASIEMAVHEVEASGIVDMTNLGLTGYSRGTELVTYSITHSKFFRAVSGAAGDCSPYFYYMTSKSIQDNFRTDGLGGWPEGRSKSKWRQVAPEINAERIEVPVLNNDPDSEFLGDLALYTSLKELGKPMELIIYPNELHHVNQPRHRYQMYERNLDWFRFWLQGYENPDPAKSEQYRRWRDLRMLQKSRAPERSNEAEGTAPMH